jgi:hypothetical protein
MFRLPIARSGVVVAAVATQARGITQQGLPPPPSEQTRLKNSAFKDKLGKKNPSGDKETVKDGVQTKKEADEINYKRPLNPSEDQ